MVRGERLRRDMSSMKRRRSGVMMRLLSGVVGAKEPGTPMLAQEEPRIRSWYARKGANVALASADNSRREVKLWPT